MVLSLRNGARILQFELTDTVEDASLIVKGLSRIASTLFTGAKRTLKDENSAR